MSFQVPPPDPEAVRKAQERMMDVFQGKVLVLTREEAEALNRGRHQKACPGRDGGPCGCDFGAAQMKLRAFLQATEGQGDKDG